MIIPSFKLDGVMNHGIKQFTTLLPVAGTLQQFTTLLPVAGTLQPFTTLLPVAGTLQLSCSRQFLQKGTQGLLYIS